MAKHHDEVRNVENVTDTKIKTEDTARNTTTGAVTGGIIGGAGALLAEIGVLAIPGVGPFLAAGPIAATLGGIIAGGAVGGLAGALVDLGVDEAELDEFKGYLDQGYMTDEMLTPDYIHWLYTAFTRATDKLFLMNWPKTQTASIPQQ